MQCSTFFQDEDIKDAIENAGFDAEIMVKTTPVRSSVPKQSTVTGQFRITGLSCAACVASVESILLSLDGITSASVALTTSLGKVSYNPSVINKNTIISAIIDAGFEAEFIDSGARNVVELVVEGMLSEKDELAVQKVFHQLRGLQEVNVDPIFQKVKVTFDPEVVRVRAIAEAIEKNGEGRFKVTMSPRQSRYSIDRKSEAKNILQLLRWSLIFSVSFDT
jgi:Cu+-exporting ATPase